MTKNNNVLLLKPDKGNGAVVVDRTVYDLGITNIISDNNKFNKLLGILLYYVRVDSKGSLDILKNLATWTTEYINLFIPVFIRQPGFMGYTKCTKPVLPIQIVNCKLPLLDFLIDNIVDSNSRSPKTSVYHKNTFTGLCTNYFSFCSYSYKIGLIHT